MANRPDYEVDIYEDRIQVNYRKKEERERNRIIYFANIEDFFYMHKYVGIKEKNREDWYFIGDEVGFGASNDIQQAHKRYFLPMYRDVFNSGGDIDFKYLEEKVSDKDGFKNLKKSFILNREYMEIDGEKIYLKDIKETTYHPDGRARHDPVDIAFLNDSMEVMYIFPDRTVSNYLIFHDLIEGYLLENRISKEFK